MSHFKHLLNKQSHFLTLAAGISTQAAESRCQVAGVRALTFWRRIFFFQILAHSVFKM